MMYKLYSTIIEHKQMVHFLHGLLWKVLQNHVGHIENRQSAVEVEVVEKTVVWFQT